MNAEEAEHALAEEIELVACLTAPLVEMKEIREACLAADIPVLLDRDDGCCGAGGGKCGCAPKLQLLSRPQDAARVAALMRSLWRDMARREGTVDEHHPIVAEPAEGDPPCPACGTVAPLADGACADCGLQLA
jgi:hypothetical protein